MAQDKKNVKANENSAANQPQTEAEKNAQKIHHPQQKAEVETFQGDKSGNIKETLSKKECIVMKSVMEWCQEKSLAAWEMAALLRASGWLEDKQINEDIFNKAYAAFRGRAQGGINGRRN